MSLTPRLRCCSAQEGKSALHWAAQFGEPGLLHELLGPSAAADVNSADEAGNTPLPTSPPSTTTCALYLSFRSLLVIPLIISAPSME